MIPALAIMFAVYATVKLADVMVASQNKQTRSAWDNLLTIGSLISIGVIWFQAYQIFETGKGVTESTHKTPEQVIQETNEFLKSH